MKSDSQNKVSRAQELELDAEAVARHLKRHPAFFVGREDLLADLSIPHESGRAISLLERQVILLRERNEELNRRLDEFVGNASENDTLFEKTRLIVLELLRAGTLPQLAASVEQQISKNFGATACGLLFISDAAAPGLDLRPDAEAREMLGELFEKKRTFCGEVNPQQVDFLFPGHEKDIACVAVVPIHISKEDALAANFSAIPVLVIGSDRQDHFNNSQDTLFLDFIGEVLSALVIRLK